MVSICATGDAHKLIPKTVPMCPRARIQHGTKLLEFGAKSIVAKQSFKNLFPRARERGYNMVLGFEKISKGTIQPSKFKKTFSQVPANADTAWY